MIRMAFIDSNVGSSENNYITIQGKGLINLGRRTKWSILKEIHEMGVGNGKGVLHVH